MSFIHRDHGSSDPFVVTVLAIVVFPVHPLQSLLRNLKCLQLLVQNGVFFLFLCSFHSN